MGIKKESIIQARYDREHMVRISLKLHKVYDKDIIEEIEKKTLDNGQSKQSLIKELIRKGMQK